MTAVMYAFLPRILSAITTSPEVLAAMSTITGYVVFSQVISSVAFVLDGMVYAYGPTGFRYAASTMLFSAAGAISTMWIAANAIGLPPLAAGWAGLVALMIGRAGTMLCFFLPALRTNTN